MRKDRLKAFADHLNNSTRQVDFILDECVELWPEDWVFNTRNLPCLYGKENYIDPSLVSAAEWFEISIIKAHDLFVECAIFQVVGEINEMIDED